MSNGWVSIVVLAYNHLEGNEEVLEIFAEELRFNFSDFIEFYKSILKNCLIILLACLNSNLSHVREKVDKFTSIFTLDDLKEVRYSLEGS
jgi:hypothetical protein